jgi:predicted alpha/beta-hydrolase family hydrolase
MMHDRYPVCRKCHMERASATCWRMMPHPFMAAVANGLAEARRRHAALSVTLPDSPKLAQAAVRAAVVEASRLVRELALIAGGKSFGGRMTSQAQAASPLPRVRGLVFLGFPLHPPGRPSDEPAAHLFQVDIPMLLQGTRDVLADTQLMQPLVQRLGTRATLKLFQDADHSFHLPSRTGRQDSEVRAEILDALAGWIETVILKSPLRAAGARPRWA